MNPTTPEKWLTLAQLRAELGKVLPGRRDGTQVPPTSRTLYKWQTGPNPMPFIPKPSSGQGTGHRTGRWYVLSEVMTWLQDPVAYWKRKKASA
jgi:hypothetical protein